MWKWRTQQKEHGLFRYDTKHARYIIHTYRRNGFVDNCWTAIISPSYLTVNYELCVCFLMYRYMTGSYCTAVEALEMQLCPGSATSVVSILTWLRKIMFPWPPLRVCCIVHWMPSTPGTKNIFGTQRCSRIVLVLLVLLLLIVLVLVLRICDAATVATALITDPCTAIKQTRRVVFSSVFW